MVENVELSKKIKDLIWHINDIPKDRELNTLYVTDMTFCLRKSFFNIMFNAKTPRQWNMVLGSLLHEVCEKLIKDAIGAETEVECGYEFDGWRIVGRADLVTDDAVYDFKFVKYTENEDTLFEYSLQVNAYATMLNKEKYYVIFVNVTNGDVKAYEFKQLDALWQEFLDRARVIIDAVESNGDKLPPRTKYQWMCRYCPYSFVCHRLDKTEVTLEDLHNVDYVITDENESE